MISINQKGQASIFVLALVGVILVCTIFLFESGRITSEKMQLQNAADSAAFGATTLEARSLNFAAYTNRAMVANEVAIGQMVGILSFVDELKSTGEYIDTYAGLLEAATAWLFAVITVGDVIEAVISAIVEILEDIGTTITDVGEDVEKTLEPIISPCIRGLSIVNTVYSYTQTIYHGATMVLVTTNILQSLEDNVPGTTKFNMLNMFDSHKPGAQLSDFGVLALVGHIPSYWSGYTTRYTTAKKKKKKSKEEEEKEEEEKKEQELLTAQERQIKKDEKQIKEDLKKVKEDQKIYKSDKKKLAKATALLAKKKLQCGKLKLALNKAEKKYKKGDERLERAREQYNTCSKEQKRAEDQHQELVLNVAKDKSKLDRDQAKLDADQDKLKRDKEKYQEEEKKYEEEEKDKKEEPDEENEGMKRMAATIREARDPFSSGGPPVHDKNIFGLDYKFGNRDWEFGLGYDWDWSVHLPDSKAYGKLGYFLGFDSKGGSEIRHKGNSYTWSAVDTAVFESTLTIELGLEVYAPPFDFHFGGPISVAVPTGGGAYQATGKGEPEEGGENEEGSGGLGNVLTPLDMPPWLGYVGKPKAYGEAGYPYSRWLSWEGATVEMDENVIEGNPYSGLQPYRDMKKMDQGDPPKLAFMSPYFIVGVIRRYDDIHSSGPQFEGNLNLLEENPEKIDRIGAIAKAELYFNRPTDLNYFLRDDKQKEKPNVFSPFWQARLAKTTDLDRFIAMAVQHDTIWVSKKDAGKIAGLGKIKSDFEAILTFVDKTEQKLGDLLSIF